MPRRNRLGLDQPLDLHEGIAVMHALDCYHTIAGYAEDNEQALALFVGIMQLAKLRMLEADAKTKVAAAESAPTTTLPALMPRNQTH